jgi:ATP-binding cassette subfamily B protein
MFSDILKKLHDAKAQLPYLPRALRMVWEASRLWTAAWAILLILQGVLPVASVYLTKAVVNSLVSAMKGHASWETIRPTLFYVALIALVLLLSEGLRSLNTWVRTAQSELVQDHISDLIHQKAVSLDLGYYETPNYYDQLHRARIDAMTMPLALMENLGALVQNTITLIAMVAVIIPYGPWLPLLLIVGTFPALYVVIRYTLRFNRWRLKNTMAVRRTYYYDWMLTERENAAELRLFDLGDHFRHAFQTIRRRLRGERVALTRDQALAELVAATFGLLIMGTAIAWMMWRAVQGFVTLGDVALFYQAFSQGQRMMKTLLNNAGDLVRNTLFLENLFEFLSLEPKITEPAHPNNDLPAMPSDIELKEVIFRYPGSQKTALDEFSLSIQAGKITALLGENGAGKSTVIKLICRFYDPEQGQVLLGGIDLRELPLMWLQDQITVLFQEPVHYHTTAARNIAVSNLRVNPDFSSIEAAAKASGADISIQRLSKRYETVLGKWFGGEELSVGEWQRLALARAFLRQSPVIILDEPTSAMDSWAEIDWLSRFRDLVAGHTALIITHRFTTARHADIIHVKEWPML